MSCFHLVPKLGGLTVIAGWNHETRSFFHQVFDTTADPDAPETPIRQSGDRARQFSDTDEFLGVLEHDAHIPTELRDRLCCDRDAALCGS